MSELDKTIGDGRYHNNMLRSIEHLFHILRDYIPCDCERKAKEDLYRAFTQSGLELTSKEQREQYEAVMKLCADGAKYEAILEAGKPRDV